MYLPDLKNNYISIQTLTLPEFKNIVSLIKSTKVNQLLASPALTQEVVERKCQRVLPQLFWLTHLILILLVNFFELLPY